MELVGWREGEGAIRQILAESLGDTRHLGVEYVYNVILAGLQK